MVALFLLGSGDASGGLLTTIVNSDRGCESPDSMVGLTAEQFQRILDESEHGGPTRASGHPNALGLPQPDSSSSVFYSSAAIPCMGVWTTLASCVGMLVELQLHFDNPSSTNVFRPPKLHQHA